MLEVLAALTAGTVNYSSVGQGGAPELTKVEFAGLLVGLDHPAFNFAMAKYCGDESAFKLLQFHCIQKTGDFAVKHGWKSQKGKTTIMSLGALALIESIDPRLCLACNSPSMLGVKRCSCDGVGILEDGTWLALSNRRSELSVFDRFDYVGVSRSRWEQLWRERYEYLFQYCQGLDADIQQCVKNNLKK